MTPYDFEPRHLVFICKVHGRLKKQISIAGIDWEISMYRFAIEETPQYVHTIGTGDRTPQNLHRFLIESHHAAVERAKDRLLLDLNFLGPPLSLGSAYAIIADRSPAGTRFERIAYVDANHERLPDEAEFAEMAAQNRGVNVRLFRNLTEAKRWLEDT